MLRFNGAVSVELNAPPLTTALNPNGLGPVEQRFLPIPKLNNEFGQWEHRHGTTLGAPLDLFYLSWRSGGFYSKSTS